MLICLLIYVCLFYHYCLLMISFMYCWFVAPGAKSLEADPETKKQI